MARVAYGGGQTPPPPPPPLPSRRNLPPRCSPPAPLLRARPPPPSPPPPPPPMAVAEPAPVQWVSGPPPVSTDAVIANAASLLGIPYVWGGNTTAGMDCSAWVSRVWGLTRQTTDTLSRFASPISKDQL